MQTDDYEGRYTTTEAIRALAKKEGFYLGEDGELYYPPAEPVTPEEKERNAALARQMIDDYLDGRPVRFRSLLEPEDNQP